MTVQKLCVLRIVYALLCGPVIVFWLIMGVLSWVHPDFLRIPVLRAGTAIVDRQ